jgi:hypothetical protein
VGGLLNAFLCLPILRWIGVRSYAIYLWHWPVYMITRPTLDVPLTGYPLLFIRIAITVGLAELSYVFIEQPVRRGAISRQWGRLRMSEGEERSRLTRTFLLSGGIAGLAMVIIVAGLVNAGPAPVPPGFDSTKASAQQTTTTTAGTVPVGATGSSASTATAVPAPPPKQVIGIGDSVMLGATAALQARIPGMVVNAVVSRPFGAAVALAQSYQINGQLGNAIVVHMGTNGIVTTGEFDQMMSFLKDVPRVVIVNLRVPRRWEAPDNAVLAAEVARYPNTVLLDWHTQGNAHPEWFYDDGIHLKPDGAAAYADLVAQAIDTNP